MPNQQQPSCSVSWNSWLAWIMAALSPLAQAANRFRRFSSKPYWNQNNKKVINKRPVCEKVVLRLDGTLQKQLTSIKPAFMSGRRWNRSTSRCWIKIGGKVCLQQGQSIETPSQIQSWRQMGCRWAWQQGIDCPPLSKQTGQTLSWIKK